MPGPSRPAVQRVVVTTKDRLRRGSLPPGQVLGLVQRLSEVSHTKDPQDAPVVGRTVELFHTAMELARGLREQLPQDDPRLLDFWEDYYPSFAARILGPMLANHGLLAALPPAPPMEFIVQDDWRRTPPWLDEPGLVEQVATLAAQPELRRVAAPLPLHLLPTLRPRACSLAGLLKYQRDLAQIRQARQLPPSQHADLAILTPFLGISSTAGTVVASRLGMHLRDTYGLEVAVVDQCCAGGNYASLPPELTACHWGAALGKAPLVGPRQAATAAAQAARRVPPFVMQGLPDLAALRDLPRLVQRLVAASVRRFMPAHQLACAAADALLDRLQPRCLVAVNCYATWLAPSVRLARQRSLPCALVQHGIIGKRYHESEPMLPYDHALLNGEYAREALQPNLPPHTKVWLTGNCMQDPPQPSDAPARPAPASARPAILLAGQAAEPAEQLRPQGWWVGGVCEAAERLGADVWIRPHPQDPNLRWWRSATAAWPHARIVAPAECSLTELVDRCQVVVTRYSAIVLDALQRGKPALTVNLTAEVERYPFASEGGALGAQTLADIEPALRRLLHGDSDQLERDRARFLLRHLGPSDGGGLARAGEVLANIVRQSPVSSAP
ncbi:MAG: hypothetical protein KKI08_04410 [Armatimonadetes bacterium]|nr:hypothetical protein [Armatimonadota bacterium]